MRYGFDEEQLYRAADPAMRNIASEGVLSQWRHFNRGPAFIRANRKIFYAGNDIIDWLEANRVDPTALT